MPGRDKDLIVVNKDKVRQCGKESFSRMQRWHYEYLSFVLFTLQNWLKKLVKFNWMTTEQSQQESLEFPVYTGMERCIWW